MKRVVISHWEWGLNSACRYMADKALKSLLEYYMHSYLVGLDGFIFSEHSMTPSPLFIYEKTNALIVLCLSAGSSEAAHIPVSDF